MNEITEMKLLFGTTGMLGTLFAANVYGQTNLESPLAQTLAANPNIITAMLGQVLNNPSSLLVIGFLCIAAWLLDDLPFINSRYVAHITVIIGAVIFRFFCLETSVPVAFPHPQAVFIVNGTICGFVAFIIHKQAIARLINWCRVRTGGDTPDNPTQLREPTIPKPN